MTTKRTLVLSAVIAALSAGAAHAASVGLQLEAGAVVMANPPDDTYVDYHLPGHQYTADYTTAAFGAALRVDTSRLQLSAGWRTLGNQHLSGNLIEDADYMPCRPKPTTCPKPFEHWDSGGSVSQAYIEAGYRIRLGSFTLVPTLGIAENRIAWHTAISGEPWRHGALECHDSQIQHQLAPLVGISLERGRLGVGAYLLDTTPARNQDQWYPGQGFRAGYFRVTYFVH